MKPVATFPQRLLVRAPNWLGDAVMAEPALRELRRIFAGSRLVLAVRPRIMGLFEGEGLADEFLAIDEAQGFLGKARQSLSDARRLRRVGADLAVLLPNSFASALAARAGGAKRIAGYNTDGRGLLLTDALSRETDHNDRHQVRYYLQIAAQLEQRFMGRRQVNLEAIPSLTTNAEAKEEAWRMLEAAGVRRPGPVVVLNPGATNSRAKRWLPERFAALADGFAQSEGLATVIVGSPGDRDAASEVGRRMSTRAADLCGRTTLSQLKAVLSCAALVVSNDTGTAHVAAALGIPTVTIFGPTEFYATRPLASNAAVVRQDVECSPCMLRDCPIDHRCMTRVTVASVSDAARELRKAR